MGTNETRDKLSDDDISTAFLAYEKGHASVELTMFGITEHREGVIAVWNAALASRPTVTVEQIAEAIDPLTFKPDETYTTQTMHIRQKKAMVQARRVLALFSNGDK